MSGWYKPEDAKKPVWPEGDYEAVVETAEVFTSKKQNVGRKLTVKVYNGDSWILLSDYLFPGEMAWRIENYAKAIGQAELFEAGDFDPVNFSGVNVRVKLAVKTSEQYGDQNNIKKYLPREAGAAAAPAADPTNIPFAARPKLAVGSHKPLEDKDIPF